MSDSPRPAKSMSATPNGSASRPIQRPAVLRSHLCTGAVRLAVAATVVSCATTALAAKRGHAPVAAPHAAPARTAAHATAGRHAEAAPGRSSRTNKAAAAREVEAAPRHRHAEIARAEAATAPRHGRHAAAVEEPRISRREARAQREAAPTRQQLAAAKREAAQEAADRAADRATQDRVHAWYKTRGSAKPEAVADADAPEVPAKRAAKTERIPKQVARAAQPDLSTVPRKATVEDFDRALQQKTQSIRATAAENQQRTTADDDAAVAATQIPSTAPTERVAAPFTHGDLLQNSTLTASSADFQPQQATLGAPAKADAKADKRVDPRTDAAALATTTAPTGSTSHAAIRAIAAQTAAAPTPKLVLPKPAPIVRVAPAATAIAAAARKPRLDQQVIEGMSAEQFDDDDADPTAKTAIVLAARSAKADPMVKPAVAPLATVDDLDGRQTSAVRVNLYDDRGKLILIPPMKGTHEILVHQNQMAVADGLDRIEDDDQLFDMRRLKLLVALPDNDSIEVDDRLPANRRFARPWSVRFLNDLGRAHFARFHTPLVITSAVRTVAFQRRLVLTNGNAAPPTGEIASPHLYGQAVDIAKHGMSVTEIAWMRAYLTPVESEGKIDVEEEFQQACFHISIYRRYLGLPARKEVPRPEPPAARPLQQAKVTQPAVKHHRLPTAILATGLRYR